MGFLSDLLGEIVGSVASSAGMDLNASASEEAKKLRDLCQSLKRARDEETQNLLKNQVRVHYNLLKAKTMNGDQHAAQYFDQINRTYGDLLRQYGIR